MPVLFRSLEAIGFPHYEVNIRGDVRRVGTQRLLKPRVVITREGQHYLGLGYQLRIKPGENKYTLRLRRRLVAHGWCPPVHAKYMVFSIDETDHLHSLFAISSSEHASHCRNQIFSFVVRSNHLYVENTEGVFPIKSAYPLYKKTGWEELKRRFLAFKKDTV